MLSASGTAAILCGALGLCTWPARPAAHRVAAGTSGSAARACLRAVAAHPVAAVLAGAAAVASLAGLAVGAAFGLASVVSLRLWRGNRAAGQRTAATARLADALRGMVAELHGGAHPAVAAATVAEHSQHEVAEVFTAIAGSARIGARVEDCLAARAVGLPHLRAELDRFAAAWRLAATHGIPLADLLAALHRDMEQRVRSGAKVRAQLSGARASGWVLACLPVAGVAIGELIGARPVPLLFGSGAGSVLLLVGTALICAGLTWTARLTDRVART